MDPNMQPGQPINTDDAMNDTPNDNAAYEAWANMTPEEAEAKSDALANDFAGETNTNDKTGKERTESVFDLYPRQAGESNEEYGARIRRMNEMTKQFNETEAQNEAEKQELEMAERVRNNDPEALKYLEEHPELSVQIAAAVKKLEELEAIENINAEADKKVREEKLNQFKADKAYNASDDANKAAREEMEKLEKSGDTSDEAKARYEELLNQIHQTEDDMKKAEEAKQGSSEAEAAIRSAQEEQVKELNDRMEERNKYVAEEQKYYSENLTEAKASYDVAKQLNEDARAEMSDLEQRADKGENITDEMFQAAEDKIHASEEAMAAAEARMEELKQDQVDAAGVMEEWVDRGLGKKIDVVDASDAEDAPAENAEKTAEIDDPEWEKFLNSYINDADFREIYTRKDEAGNDVFDEEACKGALRNMYEAKKRQEAEADKNEAEAEAIRVKNVAEIMAEDDAKNAEANPDDGFETAEQRGLFAKLKNFFKGNKRSKAGAERTLQQGGLTGFKRFAYAALMSLSLFVMAGNGIMNVNAPARNAANDAPDLGPQVVYAAEKDDAADDAKAEVKEDRLDDVAKDLSLEVDLNTEKGEELSDLVETTSYKENIEVNISYGDFDGTTEFLDYEEKHGQHNLTKELYGMSDESLTDVQKAEQIAEGLANVLDDPIEQGQFAALGGADVVIDGKTDGITKLADMNEVLDLAQQDNEFRIALADYNKEMYRDLVDNYDLQVEHREKGSFHYSLYAYEVQREDGTSDINYDVDRNGVIAQEDFDVLQFMDKDNQNVLDKNDIGGYKYNFLKGVGIIPEDATDEEAQDIMSKIRIIGFSGKCGQLIWENITPDTGDEGNGKRTKETDEGKKTKETDEKTTKETDEKTTKETDEKTTKETDEKTTKETDEKTTKETSEKTTKETEEKTTKETSEKTTKETSEKTTKETSEKTTKETSEKTTKETEEKTTSETEYDGKTDILPDDGGANIPMGPTQEETGPTTEAGDNVDNGGNGMVDDHDAGESSTVADDNFLNGGDTGGGTDDADGGGSNDADTEASYDGGDTSGYDNGADQESGTPSVDEGGSNNDSQADPGSDGSGEDRSGGADEAMDRIG